MDVSITLNSEHPAAAIAGALAHELNNPLQGIVSLLSVLGKECEDNECCQVRVGQIRSGLTRLSRIIESFTVAYENLPREADRVAAGEFLDRLSAAMAKRQLEVDQVMAIDGNTDFYCLSTELIQLVSDAFSVPSISNRTIWMRMKQADGHVLLTCQRDSKSSNSDDRWQSLDRHRSVSGLAVLIEEVVKMGGGRAEFHYDETALDGIRLYFSEEMK